MLRFSSATAGGLSDSDDSAGVAPPALDVPFRPNGRRASDHPFDLLGLGPDAHDVSEVSISSQDSESSSLPRRLHRRRRFPSRRRVLGRNRTSAACRAHAVGGDDTSGDDDDDHGKSEAGDGFSDPDDPLAPWSYQGFESSHSLSTRGRCAVS
jgi:hypothetical protein